MTTAVLGAGAWGTALANLAARKGDRVLVWAREASRETAAADGYAVPASRVDLFVQSDSLRVHLRLNRQTQAIVKL